MNDERWQPIETAPKDGTVIDLWIVWPDSGEGERIPDAHWGVGRLPFEYEEIEGWIGAYSGIDGREGRLDPEDQVATHWMPLPEPPDQPL